MYLRPPFGVRAKVQRVDIEMCGVAGFHTPGLRASADEWVARAKSMADAIGHRGPDDESAWFDERLGLAIAHRRLAIVDLSPSGRQPMVSASGRYVCAFNGEIYNYQALRAEIDRIEARAWRGHSDTEVLLAACDLWGIETALRRANGMFAIAFADLEQRELVLARDRLGEKPLYYGWQGGTFLFGSELKALLAHPSFEKCIDPRAVPQYLRFGYVPAPWSIYAGIRKLPPGHLLRLSLASPSRTLPASVAYWTPPSFAPKRDMAPETAVETLDELLRNAVRLRMHADVPLGSFLSGGIDSSTITALMQAQSGRPVRTFSIGFESKAHDESAHARQVATALGTAHTELRVTPADALEVVPRLPQMYDEPFGDSSQIPTYLLASLTRRHVTVALSGDGGDELFGGYTRYVQGAKVLRAHAAVPQPVRSGIAAALKRLPYRALDRALAIGPTGMAVTFGGDRLFKLAEALESYDHRALYLKMVAQWPDATGLVESGESAAGFLESADAAGDGLDPIDWMMRTDQRTYLPDDILVKVDRATMAVALESRVPFLDPDVVAFAAEMPREYKLRGGQGKWLLRQVLYRYLDRSLFDRPKQGFAVPLASWLRGPLRDWAQALLAPDRLRRSGLRPAPVQRAWDQHQSGRRNLHHALWTVLMYQAWHERYAAT